MTRQPQYPIRGFRISDDLYEAVQRKARRMDLRVAQIVRQLLTEWLGDEQPTQEEGSQYGKQD